MGSLILQSTRGFSILTLAGFKFMKQRHSKHFSRWSCGYRHRGCKAVTSAHSNQIVTTYPWVQILIIQHFNKKTDLILLPLKLKLHPFYIIIACHIKTLRWMFQRIKGQDMKGRWSAALIEFRSDDGQCSTIHSSIRARPH